MAAVGAVALVTGCKSGSTAPAANAFSPDNATVQAALNTFTTGTVDVPPSCGSVAIDCPGGIPGSPTPVDFARSGLTITQATADTFSYAMDLAIVTQSPITISNSGVDCGLMVNTAAGSSPTAHLTGAAVFKSQTVGGATNELDLTGVMTGVEAADVTITGSSVCQSLQGAFATALDGILTSPTVRLCAGSGGQMHACT